MRPINTQGLVYKAVRTEMTLEEVPPTGLFYAEFHMERLVFSGFFRKEGVHRVFSSRYATVYRSQEDGTYDEYDRTRIHSNHVVTLYQRGFWSVEEEI